LWQVATSDYPFKAFCQFILFLLASQCTIGLSLPYKNFLDSFSKGIYCKGEEDIIEGRIGMARADAPACRMKENSEA
jgi:hypothetical protein